MAGEEAEAKQEQPETAEDRRHGEQVAGDGLWGANTLEWARFSPPPPYNFERVPPVRSFMPPGRYPAQRERRRAEGAETAAAEV